MPDDRATTALVILDVQKGITASIPGAESVLSPLAAAATAARAASIPVVFVGVSFRPGHPEVSRRNLLFTPLREYGLFVEDDEATAFHPGLQPEPGDFVVHKRRVSAFAGTDLDALLRPLGAVNLVVGGIATSGAVLSTVRAAADLDYGVTVLSDGCADGDQEVQQLLLSKVLTMQALVTRAEEWTTAVAHP